MTDNLTNPTYPTSSIYTQIQNEYGALSNTEKRIADFMNASPEKIIYSTVTQVADELNVAQSMVTRFCKSIGLQGFQEFKIRLAQDYERKNSMKETDEQLGLHSELAQLAANSILDAAANVNQEALQELVGTLVDARKIVVFGMGESGVMAQLLKTKLMGFGFIVDVQTDIHLQAMVATHLDSRDVAIGISQQGSTKDIVGALEKSKKAGAKTACITCLGKSPITEVSDIQLVCISRRMSFVNQFRSKASILYVIELINLYLSKHLDDLKRSGNELLQKTTESILDKLY